ncbi:hypothetical protein BMS3Abin15_01041 [bacterium BMS3Abin15]|nr:hypothetical protein BMS3Abin15_01041 [bacterium BMS3Abin15]
MNKQTTVGIIIGILLASAVSAGVFYWNKNAKQEQCNEANRNIVLDLKNQAKNLQDEVKGLQNGKNAPIVDKDLAGGIEKIEESPCDLELPVVVYERPGLLTPAEKTNLEKKMVNPFFAYYNEEEINYVTMSVEVPINPGEAYSVLAIYKNGGSMGFLFGERGGDYDYWEPECMNDCPFSDAFRAQYPQIAGDE